MTDTDAVPPPLWVILPEQFVAVRCSFDRGHTSTMDFRAFSLCGDADSGWELIHNCNPYPLADWQLVEAEIDGGLKWDGCINWQTNPSCMMHGCGPGHIGQVTAIFQTVYHIGKRHMSLLDDEVPPLPEGAIEIAEVTGADA